MNDHEREWGDFKLKVCDENDCDFSDLETESDSGSDAESEADTGIDT